MSAYIVENKTINQIVYKIATDRNGGWLRGKIFSASGLDLENEHQAATFGRALLMLNIQAVNARYGDGNDGTGELSVYKYQFENASDIQVYKSLKCLMYQCSEGDVPETPLFKLLEVIQLSIAEDIIRALPQYEAAAWGAR